MRTLILAAAVAAACSPALAQERPPIVLQPGSGMAIESPNPVGNVFIANPEVASVQVQPLEPGGKALIYVFAKAPGRTSLYALGEGGSVVLNRAVEVLGPRTVRVLHGSATEIWSEVHEQSPRLADLPAGSSVTMPAGRPR